MENEEFDVLGFNPADLTVFNQSEEKAEGPSNIYKPKPAESKTEDGIYHSVIKIIYNPFNRADSIVETQSYNMTDDNGFFSVVSALSNNDKTCPIFKAWASYRFSDDPAKQKIALSEAKGGPGYFDKRYTRWCLIQVMEDDNHPELVGKFLLWKMPKAIYDMVINRMKPSADSKKTPIPVMDYLFGRSIELEITPGPDDPVHPERKTREISYTTSVISDDTSIVTEPDGSSILTDSEQDILDAYVTKMTKVWKSKNPDERATLMTTINADPNTAKLRAIYTKVIEKLKSYCPNIREVVGYKPWDEATTARVNNYLKLIAEGKNPRQRATQAEAVFTSTEDTPVVTQEVSIAKTTVATKEDDDLPF